MTGPTTPVQRLGATPHPDGSTTFLLWAPRATTVDVLVCGTDGEPAPHRMALEDDGYHRLTVPDTEPGARYAFVLDGDEDRPLPDPASASQPDGVHGSSEVVYHGGYTWNDAGWTGRALRDHVMYELHVGTFTEEGTFDAAIERLDDLAADGITAIELLPIAQFPGGRNWGYDGVGLFAAQSTYGGPDGLRRLVDAAHARGIAVVLDVVYNHLGPEGNYLAAFGPYFSERHSTHWGDAVNVDGEGSDEVRRFFIENALAWLRDYHIDGLRLDAVHAIVDTSATPFLAELTEAVDELEEATGRRMHLIAESDLNDPRVITPRPGVSGALVGGMGCDAQWTDEFHHALHVLLTGETDGYYEDFADDPLTKLATSYRQGYVYTGQFQPTRGRRHGASPAGLPGERFVVFAQNHDHIGNRLLGDRLAASLDGPRRRLAAAAVLLSPFVPLLFMGEEYGETAPFPYFVSHTDEDLVQAVREGRRREFAAFAEAHGQRGMETPDPQGEETFAAARLDWSLRATGDHARQLLLTRELLQRRRAHPSIARMRPAEGEVRIVADPGVVLLDRKHAGDHTLLALNFGDQPLPVDRLLAAGDGPTYWQRVLDTRDKRYGGDGPDPDVLGACSAALFQRRAAHSTQEY